MVTTLPYASLLQRTSKLSFTCAIFKDLSTSGNLSHDFVKGPPFHYSQLQIMKILVNNYPSLHEHGFVEFQRWGSFLYIIRCIHCLYSFV